MRGAKPRADIIVQEVANLGLAGQYDHGSMPKSSSLPAWSYILRLQSGSLSVGWTTDLERRLEEHARGDGGRTTRHDPLRGVVYAEPAPDIASAKRRETQLKRWSSANKEALIRCDLNTLEALAERRHP
jgi:predicted GIY-YIG superfamily endonuclease